MKTASEDYGMRMRLRAALVLVCGLAAASAWAGGGKEQEPKDWPQLKFVPLAGQGAEHGYRARYSLVLGSTVMTFGPVGTQTQWTHVAAHEVGTTVYDPVAAGSGVTAELLGAATPGWTHKLQGECFPLGLSEGREVQAKDNRLAAWQAGRAISAGAGGLTLNRYGSARTYRALMWRQGAWEYAEAEFQTTGEFFPGEGELFAGVASPNYEPKALALLYNALTAQGAEAVAARTAFRKAAVAAMAGVPSAAGLTEDANNVLWSQFAGASEQRQVLNAVLRDHVKAISQMSGQGAGLAVLAWPEGAFDAVYGGARPPYTAAWLRYCYEQSRPVLAGVIGSKLAKANTLYNWQQYRMVSAEEGAKLAEAALRYLTWGMEYTLSGRSDFTAGATSEAALVNVGDWVLKAPGTEPTKDYLPAGMAEQAVNLVSAPQRYSRGVDLGVLATIAASSPFGSSGNPVAWVPGGVDTPRTFNHKVFEQRRAEAWRKSLPRLLQSAWDDYFDGSPLPARAAFPFGSGTLGYTLGEVVKPYQAGVSDVEASERVSSGAGRNSPDKSAGVDAAGLLSGVLAMCGFYDQVLSAGNQPLAAELRRYSAMQEPEQGQTIPGLDPATGRPHFAATAADGTDGVRGGGYRFSRTDIERMTVLVPDLGLVQAGDLVAGPGSGDEYQLGIVVGYEVVAKRGAGAYDAEAERKKIIVLSVNKDVGHVFVSPWDVGAFTDKPEAFQLRRLVRRKDASALTAYPPGEYDPLTAASREMVMEVTYAQDAYATRGETRVEDHWIPNTGEALGIEQIRIRRPGEPILSEGDPRVEVLGVLDHGTADHADDGTNIRWDKGGGFGLVAVMEGGRRVELATFGRNPPQREYTVTAREGIRMPAAGSRRVEGLYLQGGKLVYVEPTGALTGTFGLVAREPSRPGDDVLLRLKVHEPSGEATEVVASASDFAAVYDKKLLWRANLYMVEKGWDWNDLNPWTGDTEWNPEGTEGVQIVDVKDATWPGDNNFHVVDAVAYSINCHDSPGEYNNKMDQQRRILDYLIRYRQLGYGSADPLPDPPPPPQAREGWGYTAAPPSREDPLGGGDGVWASYADADIELRLNGIAEAPAEIKNLWPYRPGFASEWWGRSRDTWVATTAMQQSAGVDCVGLVQRSASYVANPYSLPEVRAYEWDTTTPWQGRRYIVTSEHQDLNDPHSYDLCRISGRPVIGEPGNLDRVVPGDTVYYPGYHVMMVTGVGRAPGKSTTMADIALVEAMSADLGGNLGISDRVVRLRTLRSIHDKPREWVVGRLIVTVSGGDP